MSDYHDSSCEADSYRIDLEKDYEVREWVRSLRVTESELRSAVQTVGASVAKVLRYLKRN